MTSKQVVNSNGSSKRSSSSRERDRDRDRERDKKKLLLSGESGGSSQCDTPPLIERDGNSIQGKFAGISSESIQIMAEQCIPDSISTEACANLAEDVSFRLKQLLNNLSIHTKHMKKTRVETDDVNAVLRCMDTGPLLGAGLPLWLPLGDPENLCIPNDPVVDVGELAATLQIYTCATNPSVSASWVTDSKNSPTDNSLSPALINYFNRISKAVLGTSPPLLKMALDDIRDNPVIGYIVPNMLNLAILVLTEETIASVVLCVKSTIYSQVMDMLFSLCANPCCDDIDVEIQLQQLYPILITHILGGECLLDKTCRTILHLTYAWPRYIYIGEHIILEYLSQGIEQRLSGALVECLVALGRPALMSCLVPHLHAIDEMIHFSDSNYFLYGLPEAMLLTVFDLLQPWPYEVTPELLNLDSMLYEMLGDSIIPNRCMDSHEVLDVITESPASDNTPDYEIPAPKLFKKKQKVRLHKHFPVKRERLISNEPVFETAGQRTQIGAPRYIHFNFAGCRPLNPNTKFSRSLSTGTFSQRAPSQDRKVNIVFANGLLLRFKYKMPKKQAMINIQNYIL